MDAPCKIQGSIHVFRLVNNMCPGKWVHITYMCITTVFLLLGFILNSGGFSEIVVLQPHTIIYLIFLAIFCSIVPSYLMSFGLKKISASFAAVISAMGPIVTLGLDVVILNHHLGLNEIIGAIIVTLCVTCLTRLNAKA